MSDNKYNGWTNWETWLVNLWWGDSLLSYVEEDNIKDHEDLMNYVQEAFTDVYDLNAVGFIGDVLNGFWSEVNWRELLTHYRNA